MLVLHNCFQLLSSISPTSRFRASSISSYISTDNVPSVDVSSKFAPSDVIIVDNLSRRNIDNELGCDSLTPIASPAERVRAWEEVSGKRIDFVNLDVAKDYAELVQLFKDEKVSASLWLLFYLLIFFLSFLSPRSN